MLRVNLLCVRCEDIRTIATGDFTNSDAYNNAGDQTNRTLAGTSWTLAYDYEAQLTSTVTGENTISTFVYDALGRRYSRANGGTTTVFAYGPGGILTEKQGSTFTAAYAYGNGLIRKDGEYPMFDGLGTERTICNSSQTVTGTIIQDGFGLTQHTSGSSTNPYKFAATSGYRDDGDCGLTHVGARYYDGQVGRFITRDTFLDQHPYAYRDADPVNKVDPSGHFPWGKIFLGAAAILSPVYMIYEVVDGIREGNKKKDEALNRPKDTIGGQNGGTRPDQALMVNKFSDTGDHDHEIGRAHV